MLLSALLHAAWSASIKGSRSPLGFNVLQLVPTFAAACLLPLCVSAVEIPRAVWAIVAATGLCHGLYFYCLSRCLELGELSVVYPIARAAPAFLPLVAIPLLGESIDLRGGLGLAIVVAGMIAIQIDGTRGGLPQTKLAATNEAEAPVSRVASRGRAARSMRLAVESWSSQLMRSTELGSRVASRRRAAREAPKAPSSLAPGTAYAFATLAASVGYSLCDKAAMARLGATAWSAAIPQAVVYYLLLSVAGGIVFAPFALRRVPPREIVALGRRELRSAALAALVSFASYGLILQALRTAPVSYVVATRQTSVLFALAIGVVRWREQPSQLRVLGALATAAGVALVAGSGGS